MPLPNHLCPIRDCGAALPPSLLMCRPHWYMVPAPLRAEVNRAWAAWGKRDPNNHRDVLDRARAHGKVKRHAIAAVDQQL